MSHHILCAMMPMWLMIQTHQEFKTRITYQLVEFLVFIFFGFYFSKALPNMNKKIIYRNKKVSVVQFYVINVGKKKLDVWISMGLLLAQWIKDLLAMLETQVQSLVLGRSPGGGHGNPLQCSCLENSMDREAWQVIVHRVTKSWTQLKQLSNTNICVCVLMYVTHNYMYIVYIYTHAYMHIFTYYYYNVQVLLQCCNFERFFLSFDSF